MKAMNGVTLFVFGAIAIHFINANSPADSSAAPAARTATAPVYAQPALDKHTYGTAWISQMVD